MRIAFFLSRRENHEHLRVRSIMLIIIILYLQRRRRRRVPAQKWNHTWKNKFVKSLLKIPLLALCVFGDTHTYNLVRRLCAPRYKIKTHSTPERPLLIHAAARQQFLKNAMSYLKAGKIYPKCKYYCAHWRRPIWWRAAQISCCRGQKCCHPIPICSQVINAITRSDV